MDRRNKWESLIKLDVQDIPNEENHFSSYELEWTPIGVDNNQKIDLCATIPLHRVPHFVKGEGLLDGTETTFIPKRHNEYILIEPSDHATKIYSSYHCAFGPQDDRNPDENKNVEKKRKRRFVQKRGCQAHFHIKVMYGRQDVAIITYNEYIHQDASGEFCHGKDDPYGDPRSSFAPRLSSECKSYIESLLLMGVGIDTICEQHYLDFGLKKLMNKRDTFLLRKDVLNAWKRVRSLRSQKNEDDAKSVCLWHVEEKDKFFYYKTPNNVENIPFIIGIQTPWMRDMMVKHSHESIIAMDSTFSTNKYSYELYTLLVFDEQEAGVPVAWAISSRNKIEDINEWLREVYKRGKAQKEDCHVNAFMTDDASAEIEAIRSTFDCRVLLCIWHVRRAWLKNVYRFASNRDVGAKMFERLGEIMYAMSDDVDMISHLIKEFIEEFKEEKTFIEYFQKTWCQNERRIGMWAKKFRSFCHANQETNAAIESYHFHIKSHYLSDLSKKCTRRMDWLIHTLLHRVEPYYRNKRYLQFSGFLTNFKKERYYLTALERSKAIADTDCYPHDLLPNTYKVRSQTDPTKWYFIRKFGSDLHVCDCQWEKRGNMCKHVLKILDCLKRSKINQQDQVGDYVTTLVEENDGVRGSSCHEIGTIDDVTTVVDDNDEVRWSSCHEKGVIDGSMHPEDQDVLGVVIAEAQSTDGWKSSNTSNDDFLDSVDYITSLLQTLPTREDEKIMFSQCVGRFKKDMHATFSSSSKLQSIPGSDKLSMRRLTPWFSPSKMRKRHFSHRKLSAGTQNLNERAKEHETFKFPSVGSRKKKKKKVINRPGLRIQQERDVIKQKGLNDQESSRQRRLPFSIDLNQMVTDDVTPLVDEDEVRVRFCHENAIQTRNDGGQETQEDISPKTTTMDTMQVTKVLNDNNPQEHVLPFSLDLNQAITMRDTMKSGDVCRGASDTVSMVGAFNGTGFGTALASRIYVAVSMEFKKVRRTANAEELQGGKWRLASVDEVNKSLEDIKRKRILRSWDIVRLLDGWMDGPGYGLNCVQEYKTGCGEMLLVECPLNFFLRRSCEEIYSGVKLRAKGREAALLFSCEDQIIEVILFVIKSLTKNNEEENVQNDAELGRLMESIVKKHGKGRTVMHCAADQQHNKDDVAKVARLLKEKFERGINYVTARDKYGQTALHLAAFHGNIGLCQFLIDECNMGADETDEKGENLLHFAVRGRMEKRVFEKFCEMSQVKNIIDSQDAQGKTALHKTAGEGRGNEKTKILLNSISDMEKRRSFICQSDLFGRTALHDATRTGDEEVVKELLTYGSNPLLERESDGKTALHYAVQLRDGKRAEEMARLLLEHHKSDEEKSLLLWASATGIGTAIEAAESSRNHNVQDYLEKERAKLSKNQENLLKSAINVGHYNMAWELVNRGANPDDLTIDKMTKNRATEFLENIEKMPERGRDQPTIEDGLGRQHFVEGLAALFLNPYVKTPVTVGIFGDWGMGKSSLMIQTEKILLQTAAQLAFPNLLEKEEFPGSIEFSPTPNGSKKIDGIRHAIKRLQKGNSKSSTHDSADQDEEPLVSFLEEYQHKHHQVYRSLALMDRKDMFEVKNGRQDIDSNRHSLANIPTVLTVRYNAWRYQDEKEAWAGLAVEILKAIEESMTDAQRMRSRWRYTWKEHRNEIYFQLFLPSLLAVLLSCWVAWVLFTLFNRTKNRELLQLTYGSIPITIVLAVWTVVRQVLSVVKPVSDQIMGYLRVQDHGVNLGYQHQVISDINFSKQELGEKPSSLWRFITWLWSLCGLFPETIKGTSIPKSPPPCEDDIRIIVFVDDLDRCEDTVILKVLSAVSLVLAVCEINVVLGMDMTMVKRAITNKFNDQNQKSPKDLALKYISKIIQLPLALPDANDDEMTKFLEQQLGPDLESGKLGDANVQKQSQGAKNPDNSKHHLCLNILSEDHMCPNIFKRCRDFSSKTSDPQSKNADAKQKKKLKTTLMSMLLLPSYSRKEREAIIYLGKEAAVSKRLPREWKGFLTYHRVAWNMLHRRREVRNCPGWQVQLLVWIFCCWQWKDQINLIIKNWEKLVHRDNSSSGPKVEEDGKNEEDKDSHTRTKYSLGNIVQHHLEEEEAKQQHESENQGGTKTPVESENQVEAETETEVGGKLSSEKGKTEAKNKGARTAARKDKEYMKKKEHDDKWKKLKEILIKYDVSMDCIQLFQKFRLHCKIKNLSRPSTGYAKERLRNRIPAGHTE